MRDEAYLQWVKDNWKFFIEIEVKELKSLYQKHNEALDREELSSLANDQNHKEEA